MLLPDVNVLVYAHRREAPEHDRYVQWLREMAGGSEPFGVSELGGSAFIRIVTNPKIWDEPTPIDEALTFIERLRERSNARCLTHGAQSWGTSHVCAEPPARAASWWPTPITLPSRSNTVVSS